MAILENGCYIPDNFQAVPGYRDYEQSPIRVVAQTSDLLDIYFQGSFINTDPLKEYLEEMTLGYLHRAERGFYIFADKTGKLSRQDFKAVTRDSRAYLQQPDVESNEAFGHSLVVFSCLPEFTSQGFLAHGFSRRQTLCPPETTLEFLNRIRELRREVGKIARGEREADSPVQADVALLRTYAFFKVGSNLTVKLPEEKSTAASYPIA